MQTPKARSGTSEVPQRSPRPARQLRPKPLDTDSASPSSTQSTTRTPKERSPKVTERKSPRSPVVENKRPNRKPESDSKISQLQEELKQARDQLDHSESGKKQAQLDAEESKKQVSALSFKLEESQLQLQEISSSEEGRLAELEKISKERDEAWKCELEAVKKQHSVDSTALESSINEVQWLKVQLEMVAASEAEQTKQTELANGQLQGLRGELAETRSLVENMKTELRDCKESEANARELVSETLLQLETAKTTIESLRLDGAKAAETYNSIVSELEKSRERVNFLEGLMNDRDISAPSNRDEASEVEVRELRSELGRVKSALEIAEARYNEEQMKTKSETNSEPSQREAELEAELERTKAEIEELKANLMDKETELQGITEENEALSAKLKGTLSGQGQRERDFEKDLKASKEAVAELKANLMDKETELQSIAEENETLKSEFRGREESEVEAAKCAEKEALAKLGAAVEEAERSGKRAARAVEQLEAAQAAVAEMEAEMRRLKVQSDQWRKAAEAAASMLSAAGNNGNGNGKLMERSGSLDSHYSPGLAKFGSIDVDDDDYDGDELIKKKNGNVLKKIGVLWKKPHK